MRNSQKILLLLFVGLIVSGCIYGIGSPTSPAPISNFTDARKLAMGNVQGPNSEGFSALFMNPAGIVRKNEVNLLSLGVGPNINLDSDVLNEIGNYLAAYGGSWNSLDELFSHADYRNGVGGTVSLSTGASYAGFAAGVNLNADLQVRRFSLEDPITLEYKSELSVGGGGSYGLPLGESTLFLGLGVRQIYQTYTKEEINAIDIPALLENSTVTTEIPAVLGTGIAVDAGVILKSGPLLVSVNMKNISGTRLRCQEGTLQEAMSTIYYLTHEDIGSVVHPSNWHSWIPQMSGEFVFDRKIPMTLGCGLGFESELFNVLSMQLAADYSWLLMSDSTNDTFWKNLHLGGELNFLDTLQVRLGINQGYITGGFGVSILKFFNFLDFSANCSYYAWEMGSYAGHKQSEAIKIDFVFSL